ncbi:hypothetical protein [Pontibacter russatus]|uniref:hypothetical protein n=1 Tax=Pontibacter russatus TaxID=2694929 RepID=UPI00192A4B36|nr:hypothetical protein [Pontibacter russatus]
MGKTIRRIKTHRIAKETINSFYDYNSHALIIHYSCESFYDIKDGHTPRITSIAVKFLVSAQTKSFSIHKVAELRRVPIHQIESHYDELEKEMLNDFFLFAKAHATYRWIHWNMRDINYGFEALKHRASILGAETYDIKDENKFDLARLLIEKYGKQYASHPRLTSILEMNGISSKNFLVGEDEAKAFEKKEYVKLHQSTLAKVDVMDNILRRSAEEDLKTKSKLRDIYGFSMQGIFELAKDHWLYSLIIMIISAIIGVLITKLLE